MVTIKAPAKINLVLDTMYKREDGFHEVEMIMTTVDLADYITVKELATNKIVIKSDQYQVPLNENNLAYKAAQLFKDHFNVKKGVEIFIKKKIPVAAGLAGGSSDAAATLKALKELWNINCTVDELASLGEKLGSDIPFCVYGGTALATGRGEVIKPIPSPPKCWVILVKPRIGVSTKEVYGALDAKNASHPNVSAMLESIYAQDFNGVCENIGNTLEDVTLKKYPVVSEIKNKLIQFGADAVLMSGSGPTVFALVRKEYKLKRIINSINGSMRNHEVHAIRLMG